MRGGPTTIQINLAEAEAMLRGLLPAALSSPPQAAASDLGV
jgi:hypothetical protein